MPLARPTGSYAKGTPRSFLLGDDYSVPCETFHQSPKKPPRGLHAHPPSPILRANPFPEVTDPFCRLPLPTLPYWPEAAHLGDLLRLSVRPGAAALLFERGLGLLQIFKGQRGRPGHLESRGALPTFQPTLRVIRFRGVEVLFDLPKKTKKGEVVEKGREPSPRPSLTSLDSSALPHATCTMVQGS